jgi:hypothetical protein
MGPGHRTDAFGPNSWIGGRDRLHRCRTGDIITEHRFLPGASSTFAGPYPGSCWHPGDLRTVHRVVRSARRSLCFEGELFGLFLVVYRRIQSYALVCRSSQREISSGPSSFCTWGCGRRSLSILCAFLSIFSRMGPMPWSFSCSLLRAANPSRLRVQPQELLSTWCLPSPRLCGSEYTCLEIVFSVLTVLGSEAVLL